MTEIGVHEKRPYEETKQRFPGVKHVREFVPGQRYVEDTDLVFKINKLAEPALNAGLRPWISFKLKPQDVLDGYWDMQLSAVGKHVSPDVFLIPWHEPENDMPASEFTIMFNHVARAIKASTPYPPPIVYSAMSYQFRYGNARLKPWSWFPAEADIMAVDVYSGQSFPLDHTLEDHEGFQIWNDYRPDDVPWAVTERGFITDSASNVRADTIDYETEWLKDSDCSYYIYWNSPGTEDNDDIVLGPVSETALRGMVAEFSNEPNRDYDAGYEDGHFDGFSKGYERAKSDAMDAVEELAP